MKTLRTLLFAATAGLLITTAAAPRPAQAQVHIGIQLGTPPACPYGYFDYAPYNCAPYGYYGPDWFNGGVFLGAGPWFHGPSHFNGHVDNRLDPRHGYHGALPQRNARPQHGRPPAPQNFRGNEMHDGRGHTQPVQQGHGDQHDDHHGH